MDYEKKYNEALNDMRAIYPNLKGDAKLAVEHAFPELRESEDEMIRKELLAVLNRISSDCLFNIFLTNSQKQRYISYLEKQKEQNKCPEFCSGHCVDCERNEQKPADGKEYSSPECGTTAGVWSEEDSKRYISIGTTLETSVVLSKEDYDADMSWLRNLFDEDDEEEDDDKEEEK